MIIRRYFERLEELNERPTSIAALRVTSSNASGDQEEVRRFLTTTCHPMDLILKSDDDKSLLLIGPTLEPSLWIERLQAAYREKCKDQTNNQFPGLNVRYLGSLSYEEAKNSTDVFLAPEITELRRCA